MIGKILRTMRRMRKLKQSDITKLTGIPQNTLSQYETGLVQPTFETIEKIANACNYSINFNDNKSKMVLNSKNIDREEI